MSSSSGSEVVGTVGRLSLAIGDGRAGEVVLAIRGGSEAFTAWSDEPLPKFTKVLVIEQISARSVHVTPLFL